jgi:hypothetical protein
MEFYRGYNKKKRIGYTNAFKNKNKNLFRYLPPVLSHLIIRISGCDERINPIQCHAFIISGINGLCDK